ncbi:MAG TPA: response regulator transcription factor [Planctomycetota bacterium]|nr:response regulator transcription factor [Planctomycetota bacterium]
MRARILLVEDDADLARGLEFNLRHEGYEVSVAGTVRDGKAFARKPGADLVILDLALPDGDGLEILRALRDAGSSVPVLCLTARGQETDKVMGLGSGADDYVTKPFGLAELFARIAALLRRAGPAASDALRLGSAEVDLAARRVRRAGREEDLTPVETDLLRYLLARRGQAVDRERILLDLWGVASRRDTRTLDNHVARLRKKLEDDPAAPRVLVTVHGTGYRLESGGTAS